MFHVALYVLLNHSHSFTHTLSCHNLNEVSELHYIIKRRLPILTVLILINFSELSENCNIQLLRSNLYAHFK